MRRGFVRGLWGNLDIRKGKLKQDIQRIKENPFSEPFTVYVFGEDNYNLLINDGFKCILVDKNPVMWDLKTRLYRHKLEVLVKASEDFDEFVCMDWDCIPTNPLPDNFWDKMSEKAPFQANLFQYRTKKCLWRNIDWRKVCNGGFLYIREKNIPFEFVKIYDGLSNWVEQQSILRAQNGKKLRFREEALIFDDEPSFSKWIDDYLGGWKGSNAYCDNFEPEFCNLRRKSAFPQELIDNKPECFKHML